MSMQGYGYNDVVRFFFLSKRIKKNVERINLKWHLQPSNNGKDQQLILLLALT